MSTTMLINPMLRELDVDYDALSERFAGSDMLMIKFISKFPNDPTFQMLEQAVSQKNIQDILVYSHTLKGLCANLGMSKLSNFNSKMVSDIRAGIYTNLDELFESIKNEYNRIIFCIEKY